jgi:hypothetical protein
MRSQGQEESENEAPAEVHIVGGVVRRCAELLQRCGLLWRKEKEEEE